MPDDALVLKTSANFPPARTPAVAPSASASSSSAAQQQQQLLSVCLSIRSQCGWKEIEYNTRDGELVFDLKVEVTGKAQRAPLFPLIFQLCEKNQYGLRTLSETVVVVKAITKIPKRPLRAHLISVPSTHQPATSTLALCSPVGVAEDDVRECDGADADVETEEGVEEDEGEDDEEEYETPLQIPFAKDHPLPTYIHSRNSLAVRRRRHHGTHILHPYAAALLLPPHTKKNMERLDHLSFLSTLAALLPHTTSTLPQERDCIQHSPQSQ